MEPNAWPESAFPRVFLSLSGDIVDKYGQTRTIRPEALAQVFFCVDAFYIQKGNPLYERSETK